MNLVDAIPCVLLAVADLALIARFRCLSARRMRAQRMWRSLQSAVSAM